MRKGLVLFLFFVAGVVFSQTKGNQTYYFFSIAYGQDNEVYVTDIYEADINSKDVFGKLADRYTKFQNHLLENGEINSLNDIQTGYEKNYQNCGNHACCCNTRCKSCRLRHKHTCRNN